jgi:hypothetical protein
VTDDGPEGQTGGAAGAGGSGGEPVGSVAEEAAKLFSALSGFARDQAGEYAGAAGGAADAASAAFRAVNEHIATGAPECQWCPVCQVIHAVRTTSPEVKAHLAIAANSLAQAASAALATHVPSDQQPVEKINLDDDTWEDS